MKKTIKNILNKLLLFVLLQSSINWQALHTTPLIDSITTQNNTIIIKPNAEFKKKYLREDFYLSYDKEDVDITTLNKSVLQMPFLMNMILIIWLSGEIWEIDEIDENLFESLEILKKLFMYIYPKARWHGQLKVDKLVRNCIEATDQTTFAMPFSGGLDSIHTSLSHKNCHQILITVREHRGFLHDTQWKKASENIITFAKLFDHEHVFVDSNYQRLIKSGEIFSQTPGLGATTTHGLGWVGIAAPVLMAKKCINLKIASSISWDYLVPSLLCPMVDNTIAFANATVEHDGFDCTRPDKIDRVSPFFKSKQHACILYVCQKNSSGKNCCTCEKCIRTLGGLLAIGETNFSSYGFAIDIEKAQALVKKTALEWIDLKAWRIQAIQKKMIEKRVLENYLLQNKVGEKKQKDSRGDFLSWITNLTIPQQASNFDFKKFAQNLTALKQTA